MAFHSLDFVPRAYPYPLALVGQALPLRADDLGGAPDLRPLHACALALPAQAQLPGVAGAAGGGAGAGHLGAGAVELGVAHLLKKKRSDELYK